MKYCMVTIAAAVVVFWATSPASFAQPVEIPSYPMGSYSTEWYQKQRLAWQQVVTESPSNAVAWYNLYKATRYVGFDRSANRDEHAKVMESLLASMSKAIPSTFEYYACRWWQAGNRRDQRQWLDSAVAVRPNSPELFDDISVTSEFDGNRVARNATLTSWYNHASMPVQLLEYAHNLLLGVEPNGVLFTFGDNDTYPLWMVQAAKGHRPDVAVVNVSMLMDSSYCQFISRNEIPNADCQLLSHERLANGVTWTTCVSDFVRSVAQKSTRPVYVANTGHTEILEALSDKLRLVGLALKYSTKPFDDVAALKRIWQEFRLDNVVDAFYQENTPFTKTVWPNLAMNYVAPALRLYGHAMQSGDLTQATRLRAFAMNVASKAEQLKDVERYLEDVQRQVHESQRLLDETRRHLQDAERNRQEAERNRQEAERNRQEAERNRQEAERNQHEAERRRHEAERDRQEAERNQPD